MGLPKEIRERTPAPHLLHVCLRAPALPPGDDFLAFCGGSKIEGGDGWVRIVHADPVLAFVPDEPGPAVDGFPHSLGVESTSAKRCFLAAYYVARRFGGVVWVQKRARSYASAAFADLYLGEDEIDRRWESATGI